MLLSVLFALVPEHGDDDPCPRQPSGRSHLQRLRNQAGQCLREGESSQAMGALGGTQRAGGVTGRLGGESQRGESQWSSTLFF